MEVDEDALLEWDYSMDASTGSSTSLSDELSSFHVVDDANDCSPTKYKELSTPRAPDAQTQHGSLDNQLLYYLVSENSRKKRKTAVESYKRKLTNHPGFFPEQSRFGTLCPRIPNVVFRKPKCPGLAPDVPGETELNPHNQLHCFVWPLLITIYCL